MRILPKKDPLEHKEPQIRPKILTVQVNDRYAIKAVTEPNPFRHNHQHSVVTENSHRVHVSEKLRVSELPSRIIKQIEQSFLADSHFQVLNLREGK